MKRWISLLLCLGLCLALLACGQTTEPEGAAPNGGMQAEQATAANGNTAAETEEGAGVPLEDNVVTFEPCTVVDNERITITVESFDPIGTDQRPTFHCCARNNGDSGLFISVEFTAVNGISCDDSYTESVDGSSTVALKEGETQEFAIGFYAYELEAYGIQYIEQCDFALRMPPMYAGDFEEITENVSLHVENTTTVPAVQDIVPKSESTPQVLIDAAGVKITVLDTGEGEPSHKKLWIRRVCLENNTTKNLTFRISAELADGAACSTNWSVPNTVGLEGVGRPVHAGTKTYADMRILWSDTDSTASSANITLYVDEGDEYFAGTAFLEENFEIIF